MKLQKGEVQMGGIEAFSVVTVCIITKMFLKFLPASVAKYGPSCWYVSLISAAVAYLLYRFSAMGKKGILELFKFSFGNPIGKILGLAVAVYFVFYTALNLREIIRIIKIYNFPATPAFLFAVCFMVAAVVVSYHGLHGVSKLSSFYIRVILIAFAVIFLLGLSQYDYTNLAPYGGYGIASVARGGLYQLTVFSDVFLLLVFMSQTGGQRKAVTAAKRAVLVSAIAVMLSMASYICVFDFSVAGDKTSGLIEIVKNVHYGHLFQRMESIFFLIMVVSSAVAICVWFFSTVHIYSEVFEIGDKKELLIPVALIIVCFSGGGFNRVLELVGRFGGIFLLGLAAITEIVAKLRRKGAKE